MNSSFKASDFHFHPPDVDARTCPAHSPALISSSPKVRDVRISPDGQHVVYQVQPFYRATERTVAELWLAETSTPNSARQLTDGTVYDRSAVFHPDGQKIFFLSDRQSSSKAAFIYSLEISQAKPEGAATPEPVLVSSNFGKKGVQSFEISPDGRFLAFTSTDDSLGPSKDLDAKVFGEKVGLSRLRLCDLTTGTVRALNGIRPDKHVESFTWSPDSTELLYRLRENRGSEYAELPVVLERISIDADADGPKQIGIYPRSPSGPNIWAASGHVLTLQHYHPHRSLDARTLFSHLLSEPKLSTAGTSDVFYGETNDVVRILNAFSSGSGTEVAVEVSDGTDTFIDIVTTSAHPEGVTPESQPVRLFKTKDDAIWFNSWDARKVVRRDGRISYVVAVVLSSGPRHEPPNVWVGKVELDGSRSVHDAVPLCSSCMLKLSSHLQWLADAPPLQTTVIQWNAVDGTPLDGLARFPPGYESSVGPLPAVLFIHGGPYRRDIPDYMPYFCNWRELFASAGYLVLSPNYRGSQGRGHAFASAASAGVGTYDWQDCESMVDEAIRRGLADPNRLAVAGWSHGGSLTAWGVTQTKSKFKAAIVGAGATHWEGMVMESGSPELEAAIGQRSPWDTTQLETIDMLNGHVNGFGAPAPNRNGLLKRSPIHGVSDVSTAVLMLHGERDERVPLGQAIGFWRGLKRKASERGQEAAELVVYPREPHGFVERKHAEDVLNRVLEYFAKWV
ncbi:hypothetical protein HGRIS_012724 [Hohenbuehelia grisea]|uniref:Dipeptidyl-peptidase V n=1 Tax=Hohenbuehelia grisea TaxID=104357 RepID=A0ABR3IT96_9AGAR